MSMSDEEALLAAIYTNPGDHTARLVFADWLEEHGDSLRAAKIRADIELDRAWLADAPDGIAQRLYDSASERGEVVDWAAVEPTSATFAAARTVRSMKVPFAKDPRFEGLAGVSVDSDPAGLPRTVRAESMDAFLRHATALVRTAPIDWLVTNNLSVEDATALIRSGHLARLRRLTLGHMNDVSGLAVLGKHPATEGVKFLVLADEQHQLTALEGLCGEHWCGLEHIHLNGYANYREDRLFDEAFGQMLRQSRFRNLRGLSLSDLGRGSHALWEMNEEGVMGALAGGACPELRSLRFETCRFGDAAAEKLTRARGLPLLRTLSLYRCEALSDEFAAGLIATGWLPRLATLEIYDSHFQLSGARWRGRTRGPTLRLLNLEENQVTPEGLAWLVKSRAAAGLWALDLDGCHISTSGLRQFCRGKWSELVVLDLQRNGLDAEAPAVLAAWRGGSRLQWLNLRANMPGVNEPHKKSADWEAARPLIADRLPCLRHLMTGGLYGG
jgi:uncharacterized protein (TIGR02996 family)